MFVKNNKSRQTQKETKCWRMKGNYFYFPLFHFTALQVSSKVKLFLFFKTNDIKVCKQRNWAILFLSCCLCMYQDILKFKIAFAFVGILIAVKVFNPCESPWSYFMSNKYLCFFFYEIYEAIAYLILMILIADTSSGLMLCYAY